MLNDTLLCSGCLSRVQISTMRYSRNGKKLLCESCYGKEQEEIGWLLLAEKSIERTWDNAKDEKAWKQQS